MVTSELSAAAARERTADLRRETDLLDHYWQVQRQEQALTEARRWARQARSHAIRALWSAGIGILLAAIALFTG